MIPELMKGLFHIANHAREELSGSSLFAAYIGGPKTIARIPKCTEVNIVTDLEVVT